MPAGSRPGERRGGRQKGTPNKRTAERQAASDAAVQAAMAAMPDAFDGDAHAFLQIVYRDRSQPVEVRLDAAKAAIRFEKPALAAVEASGKDGGAIVVEIVDYGASGQDPERLESSALPTSGLARLAGR